MKRCSRCGEWKDASCYSPRRKARDGLNSSCRPCNQAATKAKRQDPAVKAELAARIRMIRESNSEIAERDRATSKAWKARNPERAAAHWNNPEKRARDRERRRTPGGRALSLAAVYRRLERTKDGDFTAADWAEVQAEFQHRCAYCLRRGPLEIEHVEPLIRGGKHTRSNVVPACRRCNTRKNKRPLLVALTQGAFS